MGSENRTAVTIEQLKAVLPLLKTKVSQDPMLSTKNLDNDFLIRFLRAREGDVDKTIVLMKGYFKMRRDHPELFPLPSQVMDVFRDRAITFAPKRNSTGEIVVVVRIKHWDPKKYNAYHLSASLVPFCELYSLDPVLQEKGILGILDFNKFSFKQFTAIPAALHKLSADLTERTLPIQYNHIHIVNQGKLVDMLWAIFRPFVSDDLRKRISFHGSKVNELEKYVDKDLLSMELGGTRDDAAEHDSIEAMFNPEYIASLDRQITEIWSKYSP